MPNPAPILALLGIGTALALAASKSSAATPPAPTPVPRATTVSLDTNLPPALEDQVVQALSTSHDPTELSALAAQLTAQGYPLAAAALQARATQLQALATAPGPAAPPPASTPSTTTAPTALPPLDPNIGALGPPVLTALSTETDPAKLIGFAQSIEGQAPMAAAALMTKAAALQAGQRAVQAAQAVAQNIAPTTSTTAQASPVAPPPGSPPQSAPPLVVVPTPASTLDNVLPPTLPQGPGSWVLATDADVSRDGVAPRYAALLSQAVGTIVTESHNGRTWEFRVISKTTDPNLTTYAKDVKGWIWRPTATAAAAPPPLAPVVTSKTMATVPPSPAIRQLQHNLNLLGAQPALVEDGLNGPKTIAAVKAFQTAHPPLKVDGIAGPQTNAAIAAALNPGPLASTGPAPTMAPSVPVATTDAMHAPAPAATIRQLQQNLNLLGQQPPLVVDGLNGPKTIAAVRSFQGAHGLKQDGIAGPQTNGAIAAALSTPHASTVLASTSTTPPPPADAPAPTNVVSIQDVQAALNRLGIPQPLLKVDGAAGALTQAAVKVFQLQHGLTTDGIAGPLTKAALSRALAQLAPAQVSAGRRKNLSRDAA